MAPEGGGIPVRTPMGAGGEFDLIRELLGPEGRLPEGVAAGPGDDCAFVDPGGGGPLLAVSTDMMVEEVHFRRSWLSPAEIGYRAAAAALSDLAAVAAEPVGILVSLGLPREEGAPDLARALAKGLREAVELVGGALLGGDLVRTPGPLVLDVVALGRTARPVLRSGALPGDRIWVTGRLGGSGAALALLLEGRDPPEELRERFARPVPRVREALWLRERVGELHALIDLSDGLAGDAGHLAAASGVGVFLEDWNVPAHPASTTNDALTAGEDFELCLAAAPGAVEAEAAAFRERFGVELTPVGWVEEGEGVILRRWEGGDAKAGSVRGYDHLDGSGGGDG